MTYTGYRKPVNGRDVSKESLERILDLKQGDPITTKKDFKNGIIYEGRGFSDQDLHPNKSYIVKEVVFSVPHLVTNTEGVKIVGKNDCGNEDLKFKIQPTFDATHIETIRVRVEGNGADPKKYYNIAYFLI